MNVIVFGGTGKTGSLVVDRALTRGHTVTVLVRDPIKFTRPNVRVFAGDATNPSDVLAAMHGQNAVIETIGGTTPWKSTRLEADSIHAIIHAMQEESARRLISISMMGIGDSLAQTPFWYRYLLMPTFLHGSTQDKTHKEAAITADHVEYVIVRPPILKDSPATGQVHILAPNAIGHAITRADLANFLVDQLETDANLNRAVTVVNT
jgi:putative NADH-flavin reductase